MKKVLFFNLFHIGDVYLPMKYIQNIVESNPDVEFYYWCIEGHSFFKDINIKFASNFNYDYFYPINNTVVTIKDDFICINTWISSFWNDINYKDLPVGECEILNKYPIFERICKNVNLNYTLKKEDIFFKYPFIELELASNWFNENKNSKKIFYFNYLAHSGQVQPITNHYEHELVINSLADKYKNYIILVPDNITPTSSNIINCEHKFNITRSTTSEHLMQLHTIANMCDYSVYVDTGGCFLFANKDFINSSCKKLLLTTGSSARYGKYLNDACNFIYKKDLIQQLHCNNVHDVITSIFNNIE
jgi:hypothetical protein